MEVYSHKIPARNRNGTPKIETRLSMYIFPKNKPRIYPIAKFLIAMSLLESADIRGMKGFKGQIDRLYKGPMDEVLDRGPI